MKRHHAFRACGKMDFRRELQQLVELFLNFGVGSCKKCVRSQRNINIIGSSIPIGGYPGNSFGSFFIMRN
jgi:hypothetical protein